jgi:GT2 family glycosyltransferase
MKKYNLLYVNPDNKVDIEDYVNGINEKKKITIITTNNDFYKKHKSKIKMMLEMVADNRPLAIAECDFNRFNISSGKLQDYILIMTTSSFAEAILRLKWTGDSRALALIASTVNLVVTNIVKGDTDFEKFHFDYLGEKKRLIAYLECSRAIILSKNVNLLKRCVDSILKNALYFKQQICVAVNEKDTDVINYLKQNNLDYFVYDYKFNYSKINNEAVAYLLSKMKERREINNFVLINDDVIVQSNTLEKLVAPLLFDSRVSIVGAKLIYPDGKIQHDGIEFDKGRISHTNRSKPKGIEYYYEPSAVTFALVAIRRGLFGNIEFDERFPYSYNDVDFCWQAKREKNRLLYNPEAVAIHLESATRKYDKKNNNNEADRKARNMLLEKYNIKE